VYLAAATEGVVELVHAGGLLNWKKAVDPKVAGPSVRIGATDQHLVTSFFAGGVSQLRLGSDKAELVELDRRVDFIADLDVRGEELLLLAGWRSGPKGEEYAPDGSLGMLAKLGSGKKKLTPVHFSPMGPGVADFLGCSVLEISAVRFLGDGSFIVSPGFEDSVYRYSSEGLLQQVWPSTTLGVDEGCGLDQAGMTELATDPRKRSEVVNTLVVVDEIFPFGDSAVLLVREFDGEQVVWSLRYLLAGGESIRAPFPLTSKSPYSRIRGDLRGKQLVLLKSEPIGEESIGEGMIVSPPELLIFRLEP